MTFYTNTFDIERNAVPQDHRVDLYYTFFGKNNVNYISSEITQRLRGVHPEGKNIIVPTEKIISVMDSIYKNTYRDVDKMTIMTVGYIVDYISGEYQIERQNNNLNIWITTFAPEFGLQQTSKIKLREKKINSGYFVMNY